MAERLEAYKESFADGEWQALRGAIGDLVDTICLANLPPFAFLPGVLSDGAECAYERLSSLVGAAGAPRPRKRVADIVARPPAKRKLSSRQQNLLRTVALSVSRETAVRGVLADVLAPGSKSAYVSASACYVEWCQGKEFAPFPVDMEVLTEFAGVLKQMEGEEDAYRSPAGMLNAIAGLNQELGHGAIVDVDRLMPRIKRSLGRGAPAPRQKRALGTRELVRLYAVVKDDTDCAAMLVLSAAFLLLLRADTASRLSDITFLPKSGKQSERVRVCYPKLKTQVRRSFDPVVVERLADPVMLRSGLPPKHPLRELALCPHAVLHAYRSHAASTYMSSRTALYHVLVGTPSRAGLFQRAGLSDGLTHLYGVHSARIGGACTLLVSGLSLQTLSTIGFWASEKMPREYTRQVVRDPGLVDEYRFYNPVGLAKLYAVCI